MSLLNKDEILKRVSSYEILTRYLGQPLKKDQHILSPLRSEKTPSFCIYPAKSGEWRWYDHGGGNGGSAIDLVMALHQNCSFIEALKIIDQDFNLQLDQNEFAPPKRIPQPAPMEATPDVPKWFELYTQSWTPNVLEWWAQFGITKLTLDTFSVGNVAYFSSLSKDGKEYSISSKPNKPIFRYQIGDSYKLYKPWTKQFKFQWLGQKPSDYVFGLDQLPEKGEIVLLTGGEKDVMTLHGLGYHAVSLNSETAEPSPHLLETLRRRFDLVAILYDIDETGIRRSKELSQKFKLVSFFLPRDPGDEQAAKDISDYVNHNGTDGARKMLHELISLIDETLPPNTLSPAVHPSPDDPRPAPPQNEDQDSTTETTSEPAPERTDQPQFQLRNWANYLRLIEQIGVPQNPDFRQTRDAHIETHYHEINGKPYRIAAAGGGKVAAKRRIGNGSRFNAVYLPPMVRMVDKQTAALHGETLYLCQDELTAYLLSELSIPAVGLPKPTGFQSRPTQKTPHKLINQVMRTHELSRICYLAPATWYQLPKSPSHKLNPYEHLDSSSHAREGLTTLVNLSETFKRIPTQAYTLRDAPSRSYWVDRWLVDLIASIGQLSREEISLEVSLGLTAAGLEESLLHSFSVSSGTTFTFQEELNLQSVEAFAGHYGISSLGYLFQWGKNVYEYDQRDGSIQLAGNSREAYSVSEREGRYFARTKGDGERAISDFVMKYHLEVKQEDTFYLVEFVPLLGVSQYAIFSISDILSADTFKRKVADIPGAKFNFWGTKSDIEQIHAMHRSGVKEAKSLNELLGYAKAHDFYVYGNGLLLATGDFVEADEYGLAQVGENFFYLPAMAKFNEESQDFEAEKRFEYQESGIEWADWSRQFVRVHGEPGHMALSFLMAALYRDLYRKVGVKVFPHLSVFAQVGAGKTSLANSLSRFFGDILQTNLRTGVTTASFDRKIELYHNALIILNEFNLSNKQVQQMRLEEYLVGIYDYQGREKTIRGKSRQSIPNSAVITIGQESFWHKEAISSRCIIQELPAPISRSQEERDAFVELDEMSKEGISAFNQQFFTRRELIETHLRDYIERINTDLTAVQENKVTARLVENYAICLAPLLILMDHAGMTYPRSRVQILEYAASSISNQARRMISEGVLQIFFAFIQAEYGPGRLLSHQEVWHYQKKNQLRIRLDIVHKLFRTYIERENFGIENTTKGDLQGRLQKHPAFVHITKGVQIGYVRNSNGHISIDGNGNPLPAKTGSLCVVLDLGHLQDDGFDLPSISWTMEEAALKASVPMSATPQPTALA